MQCNFSIFLQHQLQVTIAAEQGLAALTVGGSGMLALGDAASAVAGNRNAPKGDVTMEDAANAPQVVKIDRTVPEIPGLLSIAEAHERLKKLI